MESAAKRQQGATFGVYAVILAVYFVIPDMGYIAPSLSAIAEQYGVDAGSASYLSTIVSLTQIVSALICGLIAGKLVSRKLLLSIAVTGMAVFGVIPVFFSPAAVPFWVLMVDRAIFGLFLGFLQPIIFAFVANVFSDENKRANGYGIGNVAFNVGAVFASSVGGICVGIGWNTAFWLYAIGLVVLVFVIVFYKEPLVKMDDESKSEKARITPLAWFYTSITFVAMVLDYPFFTVFISALIDHGVCDGVMGGQLLSLFTLVGIVVAAIFGLLFKNLRMKTLPVACLLCAIGLAVIFLGIAVTKSLPVVVVGVCIIAFGHMAITAGVPHYVSITCTPAVASAALAYTAMAMNLGGFVSSPYVQLVTSIEGSGDYAVVFLVSAVLMLVFAFVVNTVAGKKRGDKDVEVR